jgi:capsular polysaccharide biosynthesis protein
LELLSIWRILRRWWWLIAIPVVITAALALPGLRAASGGGFAQTITYSAMQQLDAIPRTEGDYQDIWLSSELTVNAFTDWVKSSRFREEIAAIVPGVNSAALGIAADNARSVGQIYLSYPDAAGMEAIGSAAVTVLSTRSGDYFAQLGGQPAIVTVLGQSPVTPAPPPLTDRFGALIRVGLGLVAGIGLALLAHYLDPFLRRREDVEALGLPVVGAIPRK